MGADTFVTYADGTNITDAFNTAVEDAQYEYGHRGYTGTIAEKDSHTVITHTPMPREQAEAMANDLIRRNDPRIDDKWGPAGAIPVATDGEPGTAGWVFFGWASS